VCTHRDNPWKPAFLSRTVPCNTTYLPTYPILGSLQYFSSHWDFLHRATAEGTVSFHLASQQCIAISVDKRHEFFSNSRSLLVLAYIVMLGATPSMNKDFLRSMGFDITLGGCAVKFLAALLQNEQINSSELLSLWNLVLGINKLNPQTDSCFTNTWASVPAALVP
jgi:hypothetical protein